MRFLWRKRIVGNLELCNSSYNLNYKNLRKRASKKNCGKVLQIDKRGNIISKYNSIKDKTKANNIIPYCKGIYNTSGGFIWIYEGDFV